LCLIFLKQCLCYVKMCIRQIMSIIKIKRIIFSSVKSFLARYVFPERDAPPIKYIIKFFYRSYNAPHDRTGKRPMPMKMQSSMLTAKKLKMASFSRSAVYAVVMFYHSQFQGLTHSLFQTERIMHS
jgi:hypothetical protein